MQRSLSVWLTPIGIKLMHAMTVLSGGFESLKLWRRSSNPGRLSLRRMAINLWRSLTKRLQPDCEDYPMLPDAVYAEVIERGDADPLFLGYAHGETKLFYSMEDIIEFFIEKQVPESSSVWGYLEQYAEEDCGL